MIENSSTTWMWNISTGVTGVGQGELPATTTVERFVLVDDQGAISRG
ncbi:hypothetical protein [Rhodococcus sp. MS13]|nr:hypothetical protein [Rhodococcus sp. MS13]